MSTIFLWLIILIEGFVTISAEILTIRQILPLAGSSIIVTSLIIGIFLLFLAYGYRRGGKYEGDYNNILKRNFTITAFWLGIGLSYTFILSFFTAFRAHINQNILLILTAYLLFITAPLVYILGQTVPITMNLIRQNQSAGALGGKILHLSTIGSFLGAVITSLLLLNFLGVAWTVFFNYCCLMFLSILLIPKKMSEIIRIAVLIIGLFVTYCFNVFMEQKQFVATNAYANYQIAELDQGKILYLNESPSSFIDDQKKGFNYIELIKRILFTDLQLENKDILVLGAGGFTLSAENSFGNRFTYVDIDKDLENIVKTHFLGSIEGKLFIQDANLFLRNSTDTFDAIVSDVYSNSKSIPPHLLTQEYFGNMNQVLRPKGVAIINIIGRPTLEDPYSRNVDNTIRSVFNECMVVPTRYSSEVSNIIYICQKNNQDKARMIYSHNLNQATFDFFKLINNLRSSHELSHSR